MYCPQCSTPNADEVKFCRSCGIALEAVALVLSGKSIQSSRVSMAKSQPQDAQDWLEKHFRGVRKISTGASLLAVSLLLGAALAFFLPGGMLEDVPWIMVWVVFFGWMACWGSIKIGNGISSVLESRSRLRLMGVSGNSSTIDSKAQQILSTGEPPMNPTAAFKSSPPLTVTEGTTRQLKNLVDD